MVESPVSGKEKGPGSPRGGPENLGRGRAPEVRDIESPGMAVPWATGLQTGVPWATGVHGLIDPRRWPGHALCPLGGGTQPGAQAGHPRGDTVARGLREVLSPGIPYMILPDGPHSWDSIMPTPKVLGVTYY